MEVFWLITGMLWAISGLRGIYLAMAGKFPSELVFSSAFLAAVMIVGGTFLTYWTLKSIVCTRK